MSLEQGVLGYAFEDERRNYLEAHGDEPGVMLSRFADSFPKFNIEADPLGVLDVPNQGPVGSCQGQAIRQVFSSCFFLATGRKEFFSAAAGYYLSQKFDGISGDRGSTLSGGQKVATQHGMCLEKDWPYEPRYNPRQPQGITFPYKLKVSRPMRSVQEVLDWIDSGLPVQIGLMWNGSCNREIVDNWQPGGGGHSTLFWLRSPRGNVRNINSWGRNWNGDGVHEWTESSIARAIAHRYTVMIGYAPDEMSFPDQAAIN